jgi:hypothetical protein
MRWTASVSSKAVWSAMMWRPAARGGDTDTRRRTLGSYTARARSSGSASSSRKSAARWRLWIYSEDLR